MCFTRIGLLSLITLALVFTSSEVLNECACTAAPVAECSQQLVLLGDVNQDGVVSLLDIGPFLDLVASGEYMEEADINTDGKVNMYDVDGFIGLLVKK